MCAQAYPEYNASRERRKRVKLRGTDHEGTEKTLKSKGERQHMDTTFAIKAETDVSRAQNKRMALACRNGHRTESATQTVEAKHSKNQMAQCVQENCASNEDLVKTMSLQRKILVSHLVSVMLNIHPQREEKQPRCEDATGKKGDAHGFLRKYQPPAWQGVPGGIGRLHPRGVTN